MPRKVEWIEALPDAVARLEQFPAPVLDRAALEQILGVSRRTAIRLLHRWGGYQAGRTFLIPRAELESRLRELAESETVEREQRRRERLSDLLGQARQQLGGRRIPIAAPAPAPFSPAISLNPGTLQIQFQTPEELFGYLLEISQAALHDWEGFCTVAGTAHGASVTLTLCL